MANVTKLQHSQDFTTTSSIVVTHNLGQTFLFVKVIIGGEARQDLISEISMDSINQLTITLDSAQTGYVQIFNTDLIPKAKVNGADHTEFFGMADTNNFDDAAQAKLAGVDASATDDQTGAEIKTALFAEADTNNFTDSDESKLDGIEASADVTDSANVDAAGAVMNSDATTAAMSFVIDEDNMASDLATKVPTQQSVKAYVDGQATTSMNYKGGYNASTNTPDLDTSPSGVLIGDTYTVTASGTFFTVAVADGDVLIAEIADAAVEADWTVINTSGDAASIKTLYESNSDTNEFSDAEQTKLAGVEASAAADQTGAEIKTALFAEADTNNFTDSDESKLDGIEASATADQTGAEIKTALFAEADTNNFDDTKQTKLAGIEASADVTDSTNVDAAGAVMNTDATTAAMSFVIDEDNMVSDLATKVPTQQSVKKYVDDKVPAAVTVYISPFKIPEGDVSRSGVFVEALYPPL